MSAYRDGREFYNLRTGGRVCRIALGSNSPPCFAAHDKLMSEGGVWPGVTSSTASI